MDAQTVIDALDAEPFDPFFLRLTDGRVVEIRNPGLVHVTRRAVHYFNPSPHPRIAKDVQVISLLHIVAIEPSAPSEV